MVNYNLDRYAHAGMPHASQEAEVAIKCHGVPAELPRQKRGGEKRDFSIFVAPTAMLASML